MSTTGEITVITERHRSNRWITIPLLIAGTHNLYPVLDTGAPVSGVSPTTQARLLTDALLDPGTMPNRYWLRGITIGGRAVPDLEVAVIRRLDRLGVDGLLGLDFLTRFGHIHFHTRSMQLVLEP